jgi:DNA-binding phage protein
MKTRASKLDQFAERFDEWEVQKLTLEQMAEQLALDGCQVSLSRLSVYLSSRRMAKLQERLFDTIATGGQMNKDLDAAFKSNPAPEMDQLIRVTKTLVMSLQVKGTADPEMLKLANSMQQTVLSYLTGVTRASLEERKLQLGERKVALLEKKAAAYDQAKDVLASELSPEQQRQALKEILK